VTWSPCCCSHYRRTICRDWQRFAIIDARILRARRIITCSTLGKCYIAVLMADRVLKIRSARRRLPESIIPYRSQWSQLSSACSVGVSNLFASSQRTDRSILPRDSSFAADTPFQSSSCGCGRLNSDYGTAPALCMPSMSERKVKKKLLRTLAKWKHNESRAYAAWPAASHEAQHIESNVSKRKTADFDQPGVT